MNIIILYFTQSCNVITSHKNISSSRKLISPSTELSQFTFDITQPLELISGGKLGMSLWDHFAAII